MTKSSPHTYSFKGFTVDLARACLLREGEEVKLRPKVFETLKYLVENPDRLVTKDELIKAVWSDAFVTDDSLVQCLVELRRALGEHAPACIKTVPRRGYIFAAPVTAASVETAEPAPAPPVVATPVTKSTQSVRIAKPGKSYRGTWIVGLLALAGGALAGFFYFKLVTTPPTPLLTDKDTLLIADFVNTTGDDIFDGTLKQALAVQLGQAPFLNIFSEDRIRDTLRYMNRSVDERLTRGIAREIAQRQGIKALLAGSISMLGSHYVISLEAVNARTGDVIAREQAEAENREQVLRKTGEAASKLRQHLGESLSSIGKYDTPIEQATTPSLEALKAFSLGRERQFSGKYFESIPFYKHAVELDPNFAIAYAALAIAYATAQEYELAAQYSQKAFDLKDRTSERERFYISARYYMDVLWDSDKTVEVQNLWKQTYPRDFVPRTNLAVRYCAIGQFEKGLEEARESVALNPDAGVAYSGVAVNAICLDRYDEAKAAIDQALSRKLEPPQHQYMLYSIAFLKGDDAEMQRVVESVAGGPVEPGMLVAQSVTAASAGRVGRARELTKQSVDLALHLGMKEAASQNLAGEPLWEAAYGNCREAKDAAGRALAIDRGRNILSWSALALALCGDPGQASSLVDELSRRFPRGSFAKAYWIPMTQAAMEMNRNSPAAAIEALEASSRGETGSTPSLWPAYLRGLAYLSVRKGAEAGAQFQKVLDHRGVLALVPNDFTPAGYVLYPLAHLGLARAAAITGDVAKSRKEYEGFFALWKGADAEVPLLRRAREEYKKLPS
jgi:DNA-binding winged helix-turn-helix (wHTH) protein/tetratricopeptide (TPR) repeat protein